jgi:hypothetical protein
MTAKDDKLIAEGRRLKTEIDACYMVLVEKLEELGTLKRSIISKESALHSIQDRLLTTVGMESPSEQGKAKRRRLIQASDDEGIT